MSVQDELRGACIRLQEWIGVDDVQEDIDWLCDALGRAASEIDRLAADLDRTTDALREIHPYVFHRGPCSQEYDPVSGDCPCGAGAAVKRLRSLIASVRPEGGTKP